MRVLLSWINFFFGTRVLFWQKEIVYDRLPRVWRVVCHFVYSYSEQLELFYNLFYDEVV